MMSDKSIQLKVTLGYIILGTTALFSIWYLLSEIKKINSPREELLRENNLIFDVGNTVNEIYAAETTGKIALITTSNKDIQKYHNQIDNVKKQLQNIKLTLSEKMLVTKIDTINLLISDKQKNFNEIIKLKREHINSNTFNQAFEKFRDEKKKFDTYANVDIEPIKNEKKSLIQRIFNSTDENETNERLKKEIQNRIKIEEQHQNKRDSLALEAETIFYEAIQKENQLQSQYLKKEQRLMVKNKFLTEEIKLLLTQVEENVIQKSTLKIKEAKQKLNDTTTNVIYVGAAALLLVLILGLIIIRDLNKSHRYKKELEVLNKNLEKLMRQKSMFFATVTHDIVSPLNTLVGFTELLEQTELNQKQKKYLKNINYSTSYIQNLANDLTDFSKLEYNKIVLKRENFNFLELIESIFEPLTDTANQKDIDLFYEVSPDLNDIFFSDPYRIKQILTNITTNAIKFTNEGEVTVKAILEKNRIKISIKDTGIGIEQKYQADIFNEFKQAHGGIEKIYGGTGLGLNISKGLVELLGGTIDLTSEFGKGTEFIIYFPKVKKDKEIVKNTELHFDNTKELKNQNILIIDDDPLQLQLLSEILKNKVSDIKTINNGLLIEEELHKKKFDLIITDIQMPTLNGYEILKRIRTNDENKNIPVIAFTGKLDMNDTDLLKIGFNALIHKPINSKKLFYEIHRVLKINFNQSEKTKNTSINLSFEEFNLNELFLFSDSDLNSLKQIVNLFISETEKNILELEKASFEKNLEKISGIAHKMIPMFKQLQINNIVNQLVKLEREIEKFQNEELKTFIYNLNIEIKKILLKIKKTEL